MAGEQSRLLCIVIADKNMTELSVNVTELPRKLRKAKHTRKSAVTVNCRTLSLEQGTAEQGAAEQGAAKQVDQERVEQDLSPLC